MIGNIGHTDRLDYTAIGDTVNTAAGLEAASKQLGADVVLSQQTLAGLAAAGRARFTDAGEVLLADKSRPLPVAVLRAGPPLGNDAELAA